MSAPARGGAARRAVKRGLDVVVSALALILLAPLLAVIAAGVLLTTGRPVLFRQPRPGRGGRIFTLHKFRTMTDARGPEGGLAPDADRLTPYGRWLRRTSLDELPELWDVLRGRMSLVGPRPLLVEYLERYTPRQARRHEVRPGVTGLSQVTHRNAASWEDRLELDVWYVDNWTLALDVRILGRTLLVVLRGAGVSQPGHATVEPFRGVVDR